MLEEIDAGLPITDAAELTGLSRVTMHHWLRAHRRDELVEQGLGCR